MTILKTVWNRSRQLSLQIFEKPKVKTLEYYRLMTRNATSMDELQLNILAKLMFWRDFIGRKEDESVNFVLANDVMFGIAK
jgi:ribonuclease D